MIYSLNSFIPLSINCLQNSGDLLVLYGKNEVLIMRLLENGELDRVRVKTEKTILRGHFAKHRLALITIDSKLHLYSPRSKDALWLPWNHKEFDVGEIHSCFCLDESNLLLGYVDGTVRTYCPSNNVLELEVKGPEKPVTYLSKHIIGYDSGEFYSIRGNILPNENNDSIFPILLDSVDDLSLIAKYDCVFFYKNCDLIKQQKVDGQIVGGCIMSGDSYQVCSKAGTVFNSICVKNNIATKSVYGFCFDESFTATVQHSGAQSEVCIIGSFPVSKIPSGILFDGCRILAFAESPLTVANICQELGCNDTTLLSTLPLNDIGLFEKTIAHGEVAYKAKKLLEEYFVVGARPVHLTDTSYLALKLIGCSGKEGLVQGDLCKLLDIDHKTIFHHLKPLLHHQLVIRFPITLNRTFTYLLLHWSYAEEDPQSLNNDNLSASSSLLKESILKILQDSPNKALPSNELFATSKLVNRKVYQKVISVLACQGSIECLRGTEIGQRENVIRLKSTKAAISQPEDSESNDEEQENDNSYIFSNHTRGLPFGIQLRNLIDSSGTKGITSNEICTYFGVTSKAAHRILGRIIGKPPYCDSIQKQAEFSGRERRFRFFSSRKAPQEILEIPSISMSNSSSGTASVSRSESVNKTHRINLLIQLLKENNGFLEISKSLAVKLTSALKLEHSMDTKTLKRTVNQMEEEGLVKTLTISVQNLSKVLMMLPNVSQSLIDGFVEQMKKSARSTVPFIVNEDEEPNAKEKKQEVEIDKYEYGFVFGSMARAKLLHGYLLTKASDTEDFYAVDSMNAIFREMPIDLYAKLIGIERADVRLLNVLDSETRLSLPVSDFGLNMRKLRAVVEKLLELLEEVNVLQGPLNMNIPLTLHLVKTWNSVALPDYFSKIWEEIQLSSENPERWISRPLTAKERRAQKKLQKQLESVSPSLTPEDLSYLDSLLGSPAPSETAQPSSVRIYCDEDDRNLMIAITIAFHFRDRYSRMFSSAGKLPFRLLALSLFPSDNEREMGMELRRRVKNFAHNSSDRQILRKLDRDVCLVERMSEAGLIHIPLNDELTKEFTLHPKSGEDDEEKDIISKDHADIDQLMVQDFSDLYNFFASKLQNVDALKSKLAEYHGSLKSIDISKLKPIVDDNHVDLVSELETEYRTRSEAIEEYYALKASKQYIDFPAGFYTLRRQILDHILDGSRSSLTLEVEDDVLEVAISIGLISSVGKKKARLFINSKPFQINSETFFMPAEFSVPESVADMQLESPEGLLTLFAAGDISIDPETLKVTKHHEIPSDDQNKILQYSFISGRWSFLSTEERNSILEFFLKNK